MNVRRKQQGVGRLIYKLNV